MSLESASRAELLQVIADLQAALSAATTRIAELEAELARRGGPPKTPENSSTPPAKGFKRERSPLDGAKRGPPMGHPGTSRRRAVPDVIVLCYPDPCRRCGRSLAMAPTQQVGRSQVVDLPPVQPVVVEAWRYAATCPGCGSTTAADYPAGLEPTRVFGPQIEAVVTSLHQVHHVGYQRLDTLCADLFGLHLSQGALSNTLARVAARLAPQAAMIREQVRASPVIGSDETSARVNGRTQWQWVFQTPEASYHVIVPRRNGAVVADFLGDAVPEGWGSDLWKPQLSAPAAQHQICLAHQLRDLQYVVDKEHSAWAEACQALFREAIHLAHERDGGACTGAAYAAAVQAIEARCDELLATPVPGPEASRLWVRYRDHREQLFVFLHDPRVPPTNNASERALRNSVVHRKVTGGFRSDWGADAHATVTTVLDTARKRGEAVLATLHAALGAPVAIPPGLPILSPGR
jgi:transposase